VVFQQQRIPDNLQRQGAFIRGVRPGKQTATYLNVSQPDHGSLGPLFLGVVAICRSFASELTVSGRSS
jgi:preprotein translocase subunit SecY